MYTIRIATTEDARGILDIYAPYIENTSFTFETEVPSITDFAKRISTYLENWPWLVCEKNGVITGYAYATRHRERTAYQWCTECSVYILDEYHKKGIARALYEALFIILQKQGFRNVYAVINLPNPNSVALHEHCGFTYFATYEKVGYKLGLWKNVGWWKLILNDYSDEPSPPVPFSNLDKTFLPGIFASKENRIKD